MAEQNRIIIGITDYARALLPQLQSDLGCASQSELFELLILSQVHSPRDAWALVSQRPKRGRRWPVVLPAAGRPPAAGSPLTFSEFAVTRDGR